MFPFKELRSCFIFGNVLALKQSNYPASPPLFGKFSVQSSNHLLQILK